MATQEQDKKIVRYQCVSGYTDAEEGEYKIGEMVEGIGPVQYIEDLDAQEGENE